MLIDPNEAFEARMTKILIDPNRALEERMMKVLVDRGVLDPLGIVEEMFHAIQEWGDAKASNICSYVKMSLFSLRKR